MPDVPWFQRMSLDSMGSGLKNSSSCFQIVAIRLRYVISSIRINALFERSIITVWKLINGCDKLLVIYMNFIKCFFFLN